ncbi:hypothetical protein [Coleofasciculus sp.]|uniref:hypothetical protein n=1 Tax=Coleofasciculus sp. TaxID=3100458 RepID=UPI003A4B324A
MTIIRVEHSKDYTCIANKAIRDKRLSFKARGLHHLLLSYPDGWKVNIKHLENQSDKDARASVSTALSELETLGYISREQSRGKDGRIGAIEYVVRELPRTVSRKTASGKTVSGKTVSRKTVSGKTVSGKTVSGKTVSGKSDRILSTDSDQVLNLSNTQAPPKPGAPPPNSVCVSSSSKKEESPESEKPESTQVSPGAEELKQTSPLTTAVSDEIKDSGVVRENDSHVQDEHPAAESERWLNGGYKQPEWAVKRCGSKWIALPEFIKWYAKSRGKNIEFAANCLQKAESESITQLLWEEYQASLRPSKPLVAVSAVTNKELSPEEEKMVEHERRLLLLRSLASFPEGMRQRRFIPPFLSEPSFTNQIDQSEIPEWVKELMEF